MGSKLAVVSRRGHTVLARLAGYGAQLPCAHCSQKATSMLNGEALCTECRADLEAVDALWNEEQLAKDERARRKAKKQGLENREQGPGNREQVVAGLEYAARLSKRAAALKTVAWGAVAAAMFSALAWAFGPYVYACFDLWFGGN
jgi:hypothetical protein